MILHSVIPEQRNPAKEKLNGLLESLGVPGKVLSCIHGGHMFVARVLDKCYASLAIYVCFGNRGEAAEWATVG